MCEIQRTKWYPNQMLKFSNQPYVLTNALHDWPASKWDIQYFAEHFSDLQISFKLCPVIHTLNQEDGPTLPSTENECLYVHATLKDFKDWLKDTCSKENPLSNFPREAFTCYADYKHMKELFKENSTILDSVCWGSLGLSHLSGKDSTLWIGSSGAFTPCHQDRYGCNFIAQIQGRKKWTVFSPSESTALCPTRLPYEESSVFCLANVKAWHLTEDSAHMQMFEVILGKGEVLYLPKHWWHYVECLEPSISINTWVEVESDKREHINEAIVRNLVFALKRSEKEDIEKWLNPNEIETSHEENLEFLRVAIDSFQEKPTVCGKEKQRVAIIDTDFFINCLSSRNVLRAVRKEMMLRLGLPTSDSIEDECIDLTSKTESGESVSGDLIPASKRSRTEGP